MGESKATLMRLLSPAYAGREGELTAVLQYVYQAILLDGCGKGEEAKRVLRIAVEEMRHLERIGKILVSLGVPPVFTACPPYPVAYWSAACVNYAKPVREMLEADICAERRAIAGYDRILAAVKDARIRAEIGEIRSDEVRHLSAFEEMLSALDAGSPQAKRDPRA